MSSCATERGLRGFKQGPGIDGPAKASFRESSSGPTVLSPKPSLYSGADASSFRSRQIADLTARRPLSVSSSGQKQVDQPLADDADDPER